jgi:hypothetical protein
VVSGFRRTSYLTILDAVAVHHPDIAVVIHVDRVRVGATCLAEAALIEEYTLVWVGAARETVCTPHQTEYLSGREK